MIRINLLSLQRGASTKKSVSFSKYLTTMGISLMVILLGGVLLSSVMNGRLENLTREHNSQDQVLTALKDKASEIANFEADKKSFEDKIAVIANLRKNQRQPVMLLDQVARRLPERVWLTSLTTQDGELTLVGRAMANSDIVNMMREIKQVEVVEQLQLVESRRITESALNAYEFTLTGQLKGATP